MDGRNTQVGLCSAAFYKYGASPLAAKLAKRPTFVYTVLFGLTGKYHQLQKKKKSICHSLIIVWCLPSEVASESELAVCIWKKHLPAGSIHGLLIKERRDKKASCLQQHFAFFDTEAFSLCFCLSFRNIFHPGFFSTSSSFNLMLGDIRTFSSIWHFSFLLLFQWCLPAIYYLFRSSVALTGWFNNGSSITSTFPSIFKDILFLISG